MASAGKRKLSFAEHSDEKKARRKERLLFSLLPPDIFSRLAEDVFIRQGGRALASFLVAMDCDGVAGLMASNYAVKLSCALKWAKPDSAVTKEERIEVSRATIERLRSANPPYCFLCGREADRSVRRMPASYCMDLGVSSEMAACAPCWRRRYWPELRTVPLQHMCGLEDRRASGPPIDDLLASGCAACLCLWTRGHMKASPRGYLTEDVELVAQRLAAVVDFVRPDLSAGMSTHTLEAALFSMAWKRYRWWDTPTDADTLKKFVDCAGEDPQIETHALWAERLASRENH